MERSSQTYEMRRNDIWIFISLCMHNDMSTPLPRCSMLACMCSRRLCGIYVVRIPSRSVPSYYANIECEGGEGGHHRNRCMSDCVSAFCELFSINSPLELGHALHCGMNARQICVPIQHKTNGKWMRSFFVFYVLMYERTLFSRHGCTTQRKAHHRETVPAQKAD